MLKADFEVFAEEEVELVVLKVDLEVFVEEVELVESKEPIRRRFDGEPKGF